MSKELTETEIEDMLYTEHNTEVLVGKIFDGGPRWVCEAYTKNNYVFIDSEIKHVVYGETRLEALQKMWDKCTPTTLTIGKLIEKLTQYPQDLPIVLADYKPVALVVKSDFNGGCLVFSDEEK
jgi:hypothetical protein